MRNARWRCLLAAVLRCTVWPGGLVAILLVATLSAQNEPVRIIAFGAHPDDCDLGAGGLAASMPRSATRLNLCR
jgi:hypothetical protein